MKKISVGAVRNYLSAKINDMGGQRFWQDRLSLIMLVGAIGLNVVTLIVLVSRAHPTQFSVPIRYSSLVGFDVLGPWYEVYRLALFGFFVTIVNALLAYKSFSRSRITSFFLLVGAFVVALFCLIIGTAFTAVV